MIPLYDDFSDRYDLMVEWEGRLRRESPFFERIFREVRAKRVLDLGCGTGHHAAHFATLGYDVVGADPSTAMLKVARETFAGAANLDFVEAGLGGLAKALPGKTGSFDVVICVGNTLPHCQSATDLASALADIHAMLRPGGAAVLQLLNYDLILSERRRFLGVNGRDVPDGAEHVFFRFYDFPPERGERLTFNMVTLQRESPRSGWTMRADSTELLPIESADLKSALADAGFAQTELLGSYAGEPFEAESSGDIVAIAHTKT